MNNFLTFVRERNGIYKLFFFPFATRQGWASSPFNLSVAYIHELLQTTEEIILTCAGKVLNNGRWRFLQYWLNKRVKMIRGTVKPAATGDSFRPNTPRQMI